MPNRLQVVLTGRLTPRIGRTAHTGGTTRNNFSHILILGEMYKKTEMQQDASQGVFCFIKGFGLPLGFTTLGIIGIISTQE